MPGGLSQQPRTQLAQYLQRGGSFFQEVGEEIYNAAGLSLVSGTPLEQLEGATLASAIDNRATPLQQDSLLGPLSTAAQAGLYAAFPAQGLKDIGGAGNATERAIGWQQMLREAPLVGSHIENRLREQFDFAEGESIRDMAGFDDYVGTQEEQADAIKYTDDQLKDLIREYKLTTTEVKNYNYEIEQYLPLQDKMKHGLVEIITLEEAMGKETGRTAEQIEFLGLAFSHLQGLAPEDQLAKINDLFGKIADATQEEIDHLEKLKLALNIDVVNKMAEGLGGKLTQEFKKFVDNIEELGANPFSGMGRKMLDEMKDAGLFQTIFPVDPPAWLDNFYSNLDQFEHAMLVQQTVAIADSDAYQGLATANLPTQGGQTGDAETMLEIQDMLNAQRETLELMRTEWEQIVMYAKEFGIELGETTVPTTQALDTVINTSKQNMGYMLADLGTLGGVASEANDQAAPLWQALTGAHNDAKNVKASLESLNNKVFRVTVRVAYEADEVYGVPDAAGIFNSQDSLRQEEASAVEDTRRSTEPDYPTNVLT